MSSPPASPEAAAGAAGASDLEFEIKLVLDEAAAAHWARQLDGQGAERLMLKALYFDTDTGTLGKAGMALRLRLEGTRWVQTLKGEGRGTLQRFEHEVEVHATEGQTPTLDLSRHAGTVGGERLSELMAGPVSALRTRYATEVERRRLPVRPPVGTEVELALDLGCVRAGERVQPLCELEIEHLAGPLSGAFDVARDILAEGGARIGVAPKAQRGALLAAGLKRVPPARSIPLVLDPAWSGWRVLQEVLFNTLAQVLPNVEAIAEGSTEADAVHQLRVGLRRLRTALRELQFLDAGLDGLDPALGAAFAVLGQRRDDEAVVEAVRPVLQAAQAPRLAWSRSLPVDLAAAMHERDFQQALLRLLEAAYTLTTRPGDRPAQEARQLVQDRLTQLHRRVLRDGRHFDQLSTDEQHRVRKRLKRLRYLSEFVAGWWRRQDVERFLARLRPAQEALGEHNDVVVAAERFRSDARRHAESWYAAGVLQAHRRETERHAVQALRRLARQKPFWESA